MSQSEEYQVPMQGEPAQPITAGERYRSIDTLRGVAVLGILVMNIYAFAMPFAAYGNPLVMGGTEWWNLGTWFFTHLFFDQKFMTIFSMLYGAGIVVMSERALARGAKAGRLFYRRSFWLLLIGLAHGALIWMGDILFMYAAIGMLAYLVRKKSPRTLITIAICILPIALLLNSSYSFKAEQLRGTAAAIEERIALGESVSEDDEQLLEGWAEMRAFVAPTDEDVAKDVEAYRGDYAGILDYRAPGTIMFQVMGTIFFGLWRVGGLMLIGMALLKLGVFQAQRSASFYRRLMVVGYGIGLPLALYSAIDLYAHEFDGLYVWRIGMVWNYVGSILVALGHIGLVMTAVKSNWLSGLMARFAAVGRMAFTNYLMHSVVMTTVFYGYGLNLYTEIPRLGQMGFVAALISLQLLLSPWWLQRFRFGPAEWLWRSLTYWQRQPMRIPEEPSASRQSA